MNGYKILGYGLAAIVGLFTFRGIKSIFGIVVCICVIVLPFQLLYQGCASVADDAAKTWSMYQESKDDESTPGTLAYYVKINEEAEAKQKAEQEAKQKAEKELRASSVSP